MSKFNDLLDNEKPLLVDFHAMWHKSCKAQSPILQQVVSIVKTKVTIIKVDIDKNPQVAIKYEVQGVPTLILFKQGKVLWRASGVRTKDEIMEQLNKALKL